METFPFVLNPAGVLDLSEDELLRLCAANPDVVIERTSRGELVFMAPSGSESSSEDLALGAQLYHWNRETRLGKAFGSSGGFHLPNGAVRAPDAAWVAKARWERLSREERRKFAPLCPDFVAEVRSETDRLTHLQRKMEEWMANGCRLAWLVDPVEEKVYVYRPSQAPEVVEGFGGALSGEDVLPGFKLALSELRDV